MPNAASQRFLEQSKQLRRAAFASLEMARLAEKVEALQERAAKADQLGEDERIACLNEIRSILAQTERPMQIVSSALSAISVKG